MNEESDRNAPGRVRDAVVRVLTQADRPLPVQEIEGHVRDLIGPTPGSSIRSYLRLNTPGLFERAKRGVYAVSRDNGLTKKEITPNDKALRSFAFANTELFLGDCMEWLANKEPRSIHAVVTDPPYGLHEYTPQQQEKLRNGKGGVWRVPPSYDGHKRAPLPRFTTLNKQQLRALEAFFQNWGKVLLPCLVPGANVVVATNPLLSHIVSCALDAAGLERRGELVRLSMTMRGGDRPKSAHHEFAEVSVMPRSMWEPWLIYRRPLEGTVRSNLRKWKTGGFRRLGESKPFGDVIRSSPTHKREKSIAPHPSLKPQRFLRKVVRASLPLGEGTVLDPFAGAGSTLSAAAAVGYHCIGIETDAHYFKMARNAIPKLARLRIH